MSLSQSHIAHFKERDQDETLHFIMIDGKSDCNNSDKQSLSQSGNYNTIKINKIEFIEHN